MINHFLFVDKKDLPPSPKNDSVISFVVTFRRLILDLVVDVAPPFDVRRFDNVDKIFGRRFDGIRTVAAFIKKRYYDQTFIFKISWALLSFLIVSSVSLSLCLFVCLSLCFFFALSLYISVSLYPYLSVSLSLCLSVSLSLCLSVSLSLFLCILVSLSLSVS